MLEVGPIWPVSNCATNALSDESSVAECVVQTVVSDHVSGGHTPWLVGRYRLFDRLWLSQQLSESHGGWRTC
jgi:hypothetical protein